MTADTNVTFDGFAGATITHPQRGGEIVSEGYLAYFIVFAEVDNSNER